VQITLSLELVSTGYLVVVELIQSEQMPTRLVIGFSFTQALTPFMQGQGTTRSTYQVLVLAILIM